METSAMLGPLDQRLYDDIYAQQQLPFPPNWTLPQMGQMPAAYQYVDAEKAVTKGLIKPFAGTVDDYPRFQQSFYTLIHIQPGPIFHKILALDKLILENQAKQLFRGLGMTAMDYVTRIVRLETEFGGPDRMRTHHSRVLRHLKGDLDGNLPVLKKFTHALETYLMNSESTEINNVILLQMLKEKMSQSIKVEYNAYKNAAMLPDNNQTLAWFLHFKTTNEAGAQEDTQRAKGASLGKNTTKKTPGSTSTPANQLHSMRNWASSDSSDDEELVYVGHTLKEKRQSDRRPAANKPSTTEKFGNKTTPKDRKKAKSNEVPCTCCNSREHLTQNCEKFYCMTPNERRAMAAKKEACFLCIATGHRSGDCPKRETRKCGICRGKHHFLLHPNRMSVQNQGIEYSSSSQEEAEHDVTSESDSQYISCAYQQARKPRGNLEAKPLTIAITYVTVWLKNPKNDKRKKVNLLVDTGANNCCLDSKLAKEFELSGPQEPYHVQVGGGKINSYSAFPADLKITGVHDKAEEFDVTFQVYKNPCGQLARINWAEHKKQWPHLTELDLPEAADRPVDGIIGMAEPKLLAALKPTVVGNRHEPTATFTRLGWVIGGKVHPGKDSTANLNVTFTLTDSMNAEFSELKNDMARFWNAYDGIIQPDTAKRINKLRKPDSERKAMETFDQTVRRLEDGKYEVGLLWKGKPSAPYNYRQALHMFYGLERHMRRHPTMRENFNKTIQEWLDKDIAHYIPVKSPDIKYILPTFMVVRTDKLTTAYRLVVDGARRFSSICINDNLLPGPSLIHHVFDILCKMRLGNHAMTCDVQLMYLNVKVPKQDQKYLCIFYRQSEGETLKVVQLSSHPFGLTSSPYVAMRVVAEHAKQRKEIYPLAYQAVENNVIVDDFIVANDNAETLKDTLTELELLLKEIGMGIHKIASNTPEVIADVDSSRIAKSVAIGEPAETISEKASTLPTIKTLGVSWDASIDQFAIHFKPKHLDDTLTLRKVVSDGGRLFDPLGLVLPVTMGGRILQQACWSVGEGWDAILPELLQQRWKKWMRKASTVHECVVPRPVKQSLKDVEKQRLITFVDASAEAQAAVVYVQTLYTDGELEARLLAAKGRVSGLKKQESIPRLECTAAAMGAEFTNKIATAISWKGEQNVYFTDSLTTLWWIKSSKPLKVYIANRVCTILDFTEPKQWYHVATDSNPADLPTRTQSPNKLKDNMLWWQGPSFLQQQEKDWPQQPLVQETHDSKEEERDLEKVLDKVQKQQHLPRYNPLGQKLRQIWSKYSSSTKAFNIVAYVFPSIPSLCRSCSPTQTHSRKAS